MWEPFVLLRKQERDGSVLPRYREGFVGRHFNKVSFVIELRALGYQFYTLRQHLLTHVPHNRLTTSSMAYGHHMAAMSHVLKLQAMELLPAILHSHQRNSTSDSQDDDDDA